MDRKLQWSTIVLSWVNLFEEEKLSKISNFKNTKFFTEIIKSIYECNGIEEISFKNTDDLALKFVKEYFPELMKERRFSLKNEDDILVLASLLMYTSCIKCKLEQYVEKTCTMKLEENYEEALKTFFELMMTIRDGDFTRKNIIDVIQQCLGPAVSSSARKSLSPSSSRNCLKDFLGSPLSQLHYEKIKEKRLNALLQEENNELLLEKETLNQQKGELEAENKKLQNQLHEKSKEIVSLKEELLQCNSAECANLPKKNKTKEIKTYMEEICQLKNELKDQQSQTDSLHHEISKCTKQNDALKDQLKDAEESLLQRLKIVDDLKEELLGAQAKNMVLEAHVKELNQLVEQFKELSNPKEELNRSAPPVEENLGQVLMDLTLQEKEEQIQTLKNEVKHLEVVCQEKTEEIDRHNISVKQLQDELQCKCSEIETSKRTLNELLSQLQTKEAELGTSNKQLKIVNERNEVLENDLVASLAKAEELTTQLSESLKTIEQLDIRVADNEYQNNQLNMVLQALSDEKKDLETKVYHQAEEIMKHELSKKKFQDELQCKSLEIENTNITISELRNQIDAMEVEIESLNNSVHTFSTKNEILENNLTASLAEGKELEEQLAESLKTIAEEKDNVDKLKTLLQSLSDEKRDIQLKTAHQAGEIKQLEITKVDLECKLQTKFTEIEELNRNYSNLQHQTDDLTAVKLSVEKELLAALARSEHLEREIQETSEQFNSVVVQKDSELAELHTLIQTLEFERTRIQSLVEDQTKKVTDLQAVIETLEKENRDFNSKNASQAEEIENHEICKKELKEELQCKSLEIEKTNTIINNLRDQMEMKEAELETLKDIVSNLNSKNEMLEHNLSGSLTGMKELQDKIAESSSTVEQLSSALVEKESQISELKTLLQALEEENRDIQLKTSNQAEEIKQHEDFKKKLEEELQHKSSEIEITNSKIDYLNSLIESKEAKLESLRNAASNLKSKSDLLENTLADSLVDVRKLQDEIAESSGTAAQLNNTLIEKESQINELKTLLQALEEENRDIQLKASGQAEEIEQHAVFKKKLEEELQHKSLEIENTNTILNGLHDKIENKEAELETLRNLVNDLNSKNTVLENNLSESSTAVKELQEKIAESSSTFVRFSSAVVEKESQINELNALVQALEEEKRDFQLKTSNQVTYFESKIREFETNIEAKELRISELEGDRLDLNNEIASINSALLSLQSDYEDLSCKNTELTSQLSSVTAGAAHLEIVIQEDNFKIEHLETMNTKLETVNLEQKDTIDCLKATIEQFNQLIAHKDTDVEQLKIELSNKSYEIHRLEEDTDRKTKEQEELNTVFKQVELEKTEIQKTLEDLRNEHNRLTSELEGSIATKSLVDQELAVHKYKISLLSSEMENKSKELSKISECCEQLTEENQSLKRQLGNHDPQLKEAYENLLDDYHRLNGERDELNAQLAQTRDSVRAEYEGKLKIMKAHMKSSCTRVLEEKEEKHAKELKNLQEAVKANQDHISQLSTNLWDTSDKLLTTKSENEELKKTVAELRKALSLHQSAPDAIQRTRSYDQLGVQNHQEFRLVDESVTVARRQSVRTVPSGIGKVFPSEDEAEEMFSNECLADLKAGRCQVGGSDPNRVSTLMYRNSLCPPHLKSSYPAETQFLPIDTLHEEEIKGRGAGDDIKLLPEKRCKDRSQAVETRTVTTPRSALRELNEGHKKPGTPSRIFSNLFSARQRRDENFPATPDRRRLSFFNKHFKKDPSE